MAVLTADTILADLVANEYLRVSYDRSGRQRSNEEQQGDNRTGWPFKFGRVYRDTGSASRYATKARDDFDELVADLEADRFGADVLTIWESSRGSRRVGEWVSLIDLCETRRVLIAVTSHHRIYDPSIPRDRRSLIDDANDSEYESAKISERVTRNAAAAAARGRPHGKTGYGWEPIYDERTGKLIGRREDKYAPMIREMYSRLAAGHSLRAIEAHFEAEGWRQKNGRPFPAQHLRILALYDAYRGKRVHIPGRKSTRRPQNKDVTIYDAEWDGLVDEALWLQVQRILTDPARKTTRPGRAKWLLSFRAICDDCGGPLSTRRRGNRMDYRCHDHQCVRIGMDALDAYVTAVVVGYLSRPDNVERLTANDGDDEALAAARLEIARIGKEHDELADKVGRGELSPTLATRAEPEILARLRAAENRAAELSTPPALRGFLEPGDDVKQRWDAAPMSTKREVLRALLVPEWLGELRIAHASAPGREDPPEERVRWRKVA